MSYVFLSLSFPVFSVIRRSSISAIMSMPKTSIYKNGDAFFKEDEIGVSFYFVISSPGSYVMFCEVLN